MAKLEQGLPLISLSDSLNFIYCITNDPRTNYGLFKQLKRNIMNIDNKDYGLIKEIKVVNDSDFKIKLFFTEKEKDEEETDESTLTVDPHEADDKSLTTLGFGDGKKITKIRYTVKSEGKESSPNDVILTWERSSHEVRIDTGLSIDQKVRFDIRKDASDADHKKLLITIKNA